MELLSTRYTHKASCGTTPRNPTLEAGINPDELEEVSKTVAAGLVTPTPGLAAQPKTPAGAFAAPPMTPAPSVEVTTGVKRTAEGEQEEEPEAKKLDVTTSPRKMFAKREGEEEEQAEEKRQKVTSHEESVRGDGQRPSQSRSRCCCGRITKRKEVKAISTTLCRD